MQSRLGEFYDLHLLDKGSIVSLLLEHFQLRDGANQAFQVPQMQPSQTSAMPLGCLVVPVEDLQQEDALNFAFSCNTNMMSNYVLRPSFVN